MHGLRKGHGFAMSSRKLHTDSTAGGLDASLQVPATVGTDETTNHLVKHVGAYLNGEVAVNVNKCIYIYIYICVCVCVVCLIYNKNALYFKVARHLRNVCVCVYVCVGLLSLRSGHLRVAGMDPERS